MTRSVVALGSNVGDRLALLQGAVVGLSRLGEIAAVSSLYETEPIGGPEQRAYYNAVAVIETALSATVLLQALHQIEADFDRTREVRWGPRTLDLDLILHGDQVVDSEELTVPHPRYRSRRFVLEPLLDAWPDATDPDGTRLSTLVGRVAEQDLRKVSGATWFESA